MGYPYNQLVCILLRLGEVLENMARVTIQDCLEHVTNRFQLVLLASKRARHLALGGAEPTVPWESDKATVVALREIALGNLVEKTKESDDT